jgi:hypothetical protein
VVLQLKKLGIDDLVRDGGWACNCSVFRCVVDWEVVWGIRAAAVFVV